MATKAKKKLTGALLASLGKKRWPIEITDGDQVLGTLFIKRISTDAMNRLVSGKTKEELEGDRSTAMYDFIVACVVDESDSQVFTREQVGEMPADIYGQLATAIREHLKLGGSDGEAAGKGSKASPANA